MQRSIWTICKQEISPATQHNQRLGCGLLTAWSNGQLLYQFGWNVDFWAKKCPLPKGEAGGKVSTELRHTLREEKRGMTHIIQPIR